MTSGIRSVFFAGIGNEDDRAEIIKNYSDDQTIKYLPDATNVFIETGFYMLSTVLKSKKAMQTTKSLIKGFIQLNEVKNKVFKLARELEE